MKSADEGPSVETPAQRRGVKSEPPATGTIAGRAPAAPPASGGLEEASPGAAADEQVAERRGE